MLTWCSAVVMWCMSVILTGGWVMWVDCYEERLDQPVCYTQAAWSVGGSADRRELDNWTSPRGRRLSSSGKRTSRTSRKQRVGRTRGAGR